METQALNLFIIDSDRSASDHLKNRLYDRFGEKLEITIFENVQKLLQKINNQLNILVLYNHREDDVEKVDISNSIKAKNPNANVILIINENESGSS